MEQNYKLDEINSNVFLSEAFFGSFWESIIEAINDKGNNKTIINRIETRRQQATKIVSTQPFPKKRDYKLCSKLMETLSEEFFKNSVNHNNMPVIGWQKQTSITLKDFKIKPFDAIKSLTSTRGRSIVWEHWEKLIRDPYFLYQTSLENSLGFTISKGSPLLCKFV